MADRKLVSGIWVAALLATSVPSKGNADRGEAYVRAGGGGSLSFFKNPCLGHSSRRPHLNATTIAIEGLGGIGVSDVLSVGLGGRVYIYRQVTERDVSAQGFVHGNATYETIHIQIPISVTGLWNRGYPLGIGLTFEAGIEWHRWDLQAIASSNNVAFDYAIEPSCEWSTAFFSGLYPFMEWRYFDHFSFSVGPRAIFSSTGSLHVGVAIGATLLWGVGFF